MDQLWTPIFSFLVFVLFFAIGDWVSNLTKSRVSGLLVAMILYLVGFQTGIIPADSIASTGIPAVASNFAIMLLLVGMGTMLDLKSLAAQWKTVVIALAGLVGLAACSFTVSSWLFGRDWSLCASAPISGGIIAGQITAEAANAAGRGDLAGFAMLVIGVQGFVGIPVCGFFLRKYCAGLISGKFEMMKPKEVSDTPKKKLLDFNPKWMGGDNTVIARMALVGFLAFVISNACADIDYVKYVTNANVLYLIVGIVFCVLGFLPENAHMKAHVSGFLMLCVMSVVPGNLAKISLPDLKRMVVPLVGTLVVGSIFVCLFGAVVGKLLKVHWTMAFAIAICCTIGYPSTQLVVDEVTRNLDCDEATRTRIYDSVMPPIIVSGFTSVTIASVVFASIISKIIF